jgi:phosphate transport system substrate-binding protein
MNQGQIFLAALLFLFIGCLSKGNPETEIKIKGSDTLLPVSQQFSELYLEKAPEIRISVVGGGSGVGIEALMQGTTNIAMSSRKLKIQEKIELEDLQKPWVELPVANDALAVIVHPENPVKKLTKEQLKGIFTGKIVNWKDLGGKDQKIVVYSRESSSGTFEFFKELILDGQDFASNTLMMSATGLLMQAISQTESSIAYVGLAYVNKSVSKVAVSFDSGVTFVMPELATALNKTYPITRPLYFYYLKQDSARLSDFLTFIKSPEQQNEILKIGYLPAVSY